MRPSLVLFILLVASFCFFVSAVQAQQRYSVSFAGALGLNTVPSARMDKPGTVRVYTSLADPYLHAGLGFQMAGPLYVALRQSALTSDINGDVDRLYPGVDLRLRLMEEGPWRPEMTLGLQSAFGHKRMAGEYLVLSKRYKNFDFTGGMAWGRLGSAAHMANPLKVISSHFGKARSLDGEEPNGFKNWFTGENIGFFGGIEYFPALTPGDLSLKFDVGADRYLAEAASLEFDPPAPWSAGFNVKPAPWMDMGGAVIGGEILMGTLSLQIPVAKWPLRTAANKSAPPMRPYRTGLALPKEIAKAAAKNDILLFDFHEKPRTISAKLEASGGRPMPQQLGRAARHMANHAGDMVEELKLTPTQYGLRGPAVRFLRSDFEKAVLHRYGSPQEIWQNVAFDTARIETPEKRPLSQRFKDFLSYRAPAKLSFLVDNQFSLSEEDSGLLYRTSVVGNSTQKLSRHLVAGTSFRINLADNLSRLHDIRPRLLLPVRGNVDRFAGKRVGLDRMYTAYLTSYNADWHVGAMGGYLEEMYQGFGGEVLYRPFGKTFALGVDAWQVFKRDPETALNMGLNGDHLLTGHVNFWYEVPNTDITVQARIGRYLAADLGATLALERRFDNGAFLRGFVTATDQADWDLYGGTTHLHSGLELVMPLGSLPVLPDGSAIRFSAAPLGRNAGQALDKPLPLYELTEQLSYRHISRSWKTVLD